MPNDQPTMLLRLDDRHQQMLADLGADEGLGQQQMVDRLIETAHARRTAAAGAEASEDSSDVVAGVDFRPALDRLRDL
jgi:hypothetical protein